MHSAVITERFKDRTLHSFQHRDGTVEKDITRVDFVNKYDTVTRSGVGCLAKGRIKVHEGWMLAGNSIEEINKQKRFNHRNKKADKTLYSFIHEDGTLEENITRLAFTDKYEEVTLRGAGVLVKGIQKTHKGWRLAS